ncbi:hypothetical protein AYO43_01345 [Nitrospira sp. SCGC AG-212-E16]|nr:hypothetical protein AYO43_01345 [Nitrospira sp. SCGC AG-212-E16]
MAERLTGKRCASSDMHWSSAADRGFSSNCTCAEAVTAGERVVYVNRKLFDGESNLIYRIESNRSAEGKVEG